MLRAYLAVFAGAGLASAVVTDASQDSERRKPGPEEIHRDSRRGATALFLATVVVAALDAGRVHWTRPASETTQDFAMAALIPAVSLQIWAKTVNPFFSTAICIQTGRGHELVTRGPYRFIRHPGYLAMMTFVPATALALGSPIALIPAFCYSALILWRTEREDKFLVDRLTDYAGYATRVRHRLIPAFW